MSIEPFRIPEKDLNKRMREDIDDYFETENNDFKYEGDNNFEIPRMISDYEFNQDFIDLVYDYYRKAISRRKREPLDEDSFEYHFFHGGSFDEPYIYGNPEDGYVLGFTKQQVFIPTHFAPRTLRGGYNLFNYLGNSKHIPDVLSITEDLVETIQKIDSWKVLDETYSTYFRDEMVGKTIVYNSYPNIEDKLILLVQEIMAERYEK